MSGTNFGCFYLVYTTDRPLVQARCRAHKITVPYCYLHLIRHLPIERIFRGTCIRAKVIHIGIQAQKSLPKMRRQTEDPMHGTVLTKASSRYVSEKFVPGLSCSPPWATRYVHHSGLLTVANVCVHHIVGQNDTEEVDGDHGGSHLPSLPPLRPSSTPPQPSHDNSERDSSTPAVLVVVLSVLCVIVLVTVVLVLVVRLRRHWRKASNSTSSDEAVVTGNGTSLSLLSSTLPPQHLEWCRPHSTSPASLPLPSLLPPPPVALPQCPSPVSHDYSEIATPPATIRPRPSHQYDEVATSPKPSHQYDEVADCVPTNQESCDSHMTQSHSLPHSSSQDGVASSHCSSLSIQDFAPNWIISPACSELTQQKVYRRVEPYRVSLILPSWDDGCRATLAVRGRTSSCNDLDVSDRYNHLVGTEGYGSLEERGVHAYATLEPFLRLEPVRLRSYSCGGSLYNHLHH